MEPDEEPPEGDLDTTRGLMLLTWEPTASIRVKVDTGVGGNILPLRFFSQMYPDQIGPDGLPKGLTPMPM